MDLVGIGIAIFFGFLAFAVKSMPAPLAWGGVALGLVIVVWRHIPVDPKYNGPLVIAAAVFVLVVAAVSWIFSISSATPPAAPKQPTTVMEVPPLAQITLSPAQEHLLSILVGYMRQFSANKLVIGRESGVLVFDDQDRGHGISLIQDLFGVTDVVSQTRFADLMESMPSEYVTFLPEMRWDSPFVVRITDAGLKYAAILGAGSPKIINHAQAGAGGSPVAIGNNNTVIGGPGGNVGIGGAGRGGDGGAGIHHGDGGTFIGGEGGSVDGKNIWFPPAQSGYIRYLESQGETPDFGVQYPGAGGATAGWLQHEQIVSKIREEYFREHQQEAKIQSSKIEDVPLAYINKKLETSGHSWRTRIEKKYWYLYYVPGKGE
jgi:hypothetical protein